MRGDAAESRPLDPGSRAWTALPWALRVATLYASCVIVLATGGYLLLRVLGRIAPLTVAVIVALLLAALVEPLMGPVLRLGASRWLAALLGVLAVAVVVALPLMLGWREVMDQFGELGGAVGNGLDKVGDYLVDGPPGLDRAQVDQARDGLTRMLPTSGGDLLTGAVTVFGILTLGLLTAFLLFFLLKDGPTMWAWLVGRLPARRQAAIDDAGRAGWRVLARYTRGMVVVSCIDAVGIGLALLILRVPLALPLILLTFLGGFVPYLGATVAGSAAVLVTLMSNNLTDALIVLATVLTVQSVEGYLLEPLIVGRAVRLHPVAVLLAVVAGGLVGGVGGAVIAVPLLAFGYQVTVRLTRSPQSPPTQRTPRDGAHIRRLRHGGDQP
ncbi:AI-2E family transporter [Virgisporangium ochraceum]|uniref:AI-2E family transporter n=1 Tax=Virgisporangium ochraceum TaxID=65505 RepID=A0A8J4EEE1_9ACTN|nr:AI-2E family transporter [Virgisporangium ochraceum]GIJ71664.1 AI-2E family transporter [Virgisporangium ochraceum]